MISMPDKILLNQPAGLIRSGRFMRPGHLRRRELERDHLATWAPHGGERRGGLSNYGKKAPSSIYI
jgi:hypothetical protein